MVKLVPFRAEHLLMFDNRDTSLKETLRLGVEKENRGPAYTALEDEKVMGCGGIILQWPGVATVWMTLSEDLPKKHGLWITRMTKRILADAIRAFNLHRVEAVVMDGNEVNHRWIRRLGFREEGGVATAYTSDKKDCVRYQLIVPNGRG